MSTPVEVVVKTMPDAGWLSITLSILSVIVIPFVLVGVTWCINKNTAKKAKYDTEAAERRANKYADALRTSDKKKIFLNKAYRAIDFLYKHIHQYFQLYLLWGIEK